MSLDVSRCKLLQILIKKHVKDMGIDGWWVQHTC